MILRLYEFINFYTVLLGFWGCQRYSYFGHKGGNGVLDVDGGG